MSKLKHSSPRLVLATVFLGLVASSCVATADGDFRPIGEVLNGQSRADSVPSGSWKDSNGDWLYLTTSGGTLNVAPRSARTAEFWTVGRGRFTGDTLAMEHLQGAKLVDQQSGTLASDNRTITWSNGSTWRFAGPEDRVHSGRWRDSNGDYIDVSLSGDQVTVQPVSAKIKAFWTEGVGQLSGTSLRMDHKKSGQVTDRQSGSVSSDGKSIAWANGSTWTWQS